MKQLKLLTLFIIILLNSNLLKAQLDSGAYSLELISIDSTDIIKSTIKLKEKHEYIYDISTGQISGQISILPEYDNYNQLIKNEIVFNDYSTRTVELLSGKVVKVKYLTKVFTVENAERIYVFGGGYRTDGLYDASQTDFIFYDFEGNVLNSFSSELNLSPDKYFISQKEFSTNGDVVMEATLKIDSLTKKHVLYYFNKNGKLQWFYEIESLYVLNTLKISPSGKYVSFVVTIDDDMNSSTGEKKILYIFDNKGNQINKFEYEGKNLLISARNFSDDEKYLSFTENGYFVIYDIEKQEKIISLNSPNYNYFQIDNEAKLLFIVKMEDRYNKSIYLYNLENCELISSTFFPTNINKSITNFELISEDTIKFKQGNYEFNYKLSKNEN